MLIIITGFHDQAYNYRAQNSYNIEEKNMKVIARVSLDKFCSLNGKSIGLLYIDIGKLVSKR